MTPRDTTYRLATTPADYRRCQTFLRQRHDAIPLAFPTVMAERGGEVIGLLSTRITDGAIVAGPLLVRGIRQAVTVLRLIEAYDVVMRRAGIAAYHFHIATENAGWRQQVECLGFRPWHEDATGAWFKRSLTDAA